MPSQRVFTSLPFFNLSQDVRQGWKSFLFLHPWDPHLPQKPGTTLSSSQVALANWVIVTSPSTENIYNRESPCTFGQTQASWCPNFICIGRYRKENKVVEQPVWLSSKRLRMRSWVRGSNIVGVENQQEEFPYQGWFLAWSSGISAIWV